MVIIQSRPKRKVSGGRYIAARSKRKFEIGRAPVLTKIAPTKSKSSWTIGGKKKVKLLNTDVVNLLDPKTKKYSKVKILTD